MPEITIRHRRSNQEGKVPTTGQLTLGELAVNTYDGKVFLKTNKNGFEEIVQFATVDVGNTTVLFADVQNKPTTLAGYGITDAFSGDYDDLTDKPDLTQYQLAEQAFDGDYNSLVNKPQLFDGLFDSLGGKPTTLAGYGITDFTIGNYDDLSNTPFIPSDVSDLTDNTGIIFTGEYSDLENKPFIPVNIVDLQDVSNTGPSTGQVLKWDGGEWSPADDIDISFGPAGANNELQFNNNGVFGADENLSWDDLGQTLSVGTNVGSIKARNLKGPTSGDALAIQSHDGTSAFSSHMSFDSSTTVTTNFIQGTVDFDSGMIIDFNGATINGTDFLRNISEDTTPQLGGNLNADSRRITNVDYISTDSVYTSDVTSTQAADLFVHASNGIAGSAAGDLWLYAGTADANTDGIVRVGTTTGSGGVHIGTSSSFIKMSAAVPTTSLGQAGDEQGMVAFDSSYIYYCIAPYNGVINVWRRVAWSGDVW